MSGWVRGLIAERMEYKTSVYGYLTKHKRIVAGLPKTHCSDAFCIAGNLNAKRWGEYLFQKQTRRHNRQIHKMTILKGGVRKCNQVPYLVKDFRLFDKVLCNGEVGFIFGRRSSGYFDIRTLSGKKISAGISYKKLLLLEKRKTFLTELRKEGRDSSRVGRRGFPRGISMKKSEPPDIQPPTSIVRCTQTGSPLLLPKIRRQV